MRSVILSDPVILSEAKNLPPLFERERSVPSLRYKQGSFIAALGMT
jgi:hypothetical protein